MITCSTCSPVRNVKVPIITLMTGIMYLPVPSMGEDDHWKYNTVNMTVYCYTEMTPLLYGWNHRWQLWSYRLPSCYTQCCPHRHCPHSQAPCTPWTAPAGGAGTQTAFYTQCNPHTATAEKYIDKKDRKTSRRASLMSNIIFCSIRVGSLIQTFKCGPLQPSKKCRHQ